MTFNLNITVHRGSPNGWWALYIRKPDGKWYKVYDYLVDSSYVDGTKHLVISFDSPTSFDAIACAAQFSGQDYSINNHISITDVYLKP